MVASVPAMAGSMDAPDEISAPGPQGMTVILDRGACIGSADCVAAAPALFKLDSHRRVTFAGATALSSSQPRTVWRAAERCPVDAIILEDASGAQVYP